MKNFYTLWRVYFNREKNKKVAGTYLPTDKPVISYLFEVSRILTLHSRSMIRFWRILLPYSHYTSFTFDEFCKQYLIRKYARCAGWILKIRSREYKPIKIGIPIIPNRLSLLLKIKSGKLRWYFIFAAYSLIYWSSKLWNCLLESFVFVYESTDEMRGGGWRWAQRPMVDT